MINIAYFILCPWREREREREGERKKERERKGQMSSQSLIGSNKAFYLQGALERHLFICETPKI